jgi:hypothetical protein
MTIELLPGTTNVLRFPTEERARPTLDLLREIAPDPQEVSLIAEGYGLDMPSHDFRHRIDAEAAEHILNNVEREPGEAGAEALRQLLAPLVEGAVQACREARRAAGVAAEARDRLGAASAAGGYWLEPLEARAAALSRQAAELMVVAHMRSEEAEGVARAVSLARSGQPWTPFNVQHAAETLFCGERRTA